jgi:DNA-binding response OmpR family regulator
VAMRILVIEDEPGIVDFLERGLSAEGHEVVAALDGPEGERLALDEAYDLVLLDVMLPGRGGLEVLAAIREVKPDLPVIVLTARGEIADRVAGLDAGATDYVVKPFALAELSARIRAHLRGATRGTTTLHGADIEIDLITRDVRRDQEPVRLSVTEFELLAHLIRHAGEVCTREQILRTVWGYEHDPGTNVVDVYVGYLRRKLGRPDRPAPIATVRSVGYRFVDVDAVDDAAARR